MNEIVLTGCDESHFPISAMAAFGALRVLTQARREEGPGGDAAARPRLSWLARPRWTPVLHTPLTRDEVAAALAAGAARVAASPAWTTRPDPKQLTPEVYRELLQGCGQSWDEELSTALACEWPLTPGGKLMVTPFVMASGRQQWCATICEAAGMSAPADGAGAAAVEEVLYGPWRYAQELSALGWDPASERQHALEAKAPTKTKTRAVGAAVWLAAESLGLFPCVASGRSLRVPCYDDAARTFFWPVWQAPLTYDALRAVLRLPLARAREETESSGVWGELRARGIDAVFASRRMEPPAGHGYYVFWPAELIRGS